MIAENEINNVVQFVRTKWNAMITVKDELESYLKAQTVARKQKFEYLHEAYTKEILTEELDRKIRVALKIKAGGRHGNYLYPADFFRDNIYVGLQPFCFRDYVNVIVYPKCYNHTTTVYFQLGLDDASEHICKRMQNFMTDKMRLWMESKDQTGFVQKSSVIVNELVADINNCIAFIKKTRLLAEKAFALLDKYHDIVQDYEQQHDLVLLNATHSVTPVCPYIRLNQHKKKMTPQIKQKVCRILDHLVQDFKKEFFSKEDNQ